VASPLEIGFAVFGGGPLFRVANIITSISIIKPATDPPMIKGKFGSDIFYYIQNN
jgi:hypothetical protein